jgi:hypothetical protein
VIASLISLSIFAFCSVVGFGLQAWLLRSREKAQVLLSPTIGAGFTILIVISINRLGVPIGRFAIPLIAALFALTIFAYVRAPGVINWKRYWPFAAIVLVAFVLDASPLFDYNLNFLSYGNDDMANYVLGAHRLVEHGYFDIPNTQNLVYIRDSPLAYWFPFVLDNERAGSEVLLATVIAATKFDGFQLFMPVIFALGLMLVCATCGLIYQRPERWGTAILAGGLMAVSAETTLGIEYQLIAQVFGLAALATAFALTVRALDASVRTEWASLLLAGVSTAALAVIYPEVIPFFLIPLVAYIVLKLLRGQVELRTAVSSLAVVAFVTIAILNSAIRIPFAVLLSRVIGVSDVGDVTLTPFSYYLVPSGVANLFGILPVATDPGPIWVSISILLGFVLLAALIIAIAYGIWELEGTAFIAATMLILGAALFDQRNGFGLYKLAMYMQPFIWGSFAIAATALFRRSGRANGAIA